MSYKANIIAHLIAFAKNTKLSDGKVIFMTSSIDDEIINKSDPIPTVSIIAVDNVELISIYADMLQGFLSKDSLYCNIVIDHENSIRKESDINKYATSTLGDTTIIKFTDTVQLTTINVKKF